MEYAAPILFALGIFAVMTRRNAVGLLMGVELILNAANINFVAFARYVEHGINGHVIAAFVIAGVGEALVNPALTAAYLDITPEEHRSRAMGIKTAVGSLGSLLAPALVAVLVSSVSPQGVLLTSATMNSTFSPALSKQ